MEKFVLITGTSSGLGKEISLKLAKEGFKVFAGIRKQADKETLETLNPGITGVYIDVTDENSINTAFDIISKKTGSLFALVNNAGIALAGPVEYISIDILQKQFEVNVFGAIRTAQKFLPLMKDTSDARIVNMSSMASYGIFPFVSPYCVSKRALDMFFNSLSLECKMPNLKIISIKPGVVATPIWNKSVDESEKNLEFLSVEGKKKYEKEFAYLAQNARENSNRGLNPQKIANLVYKALSVKNPKLSYNIGKDSYFAGLVSFLPQKISNFMIKTGLQSRIR